MIFPSQKKGRVTQSSSPEVLIKDQIVFFSAMVEQFNLLSMSEQINQYIYNSCQFDMKNVEQKVDIFCPRIRIAVSRWVRDHMLMHNNKQEGLNRIAMNRCHSCRNTRRQLLMLKCSHDTCIKCAADNYFINCKNKPQSKKSKTNIYYCEKCLQHTELDPKTMETLRKYFMDNVAVDQDHKNGRREKLLQRQHEQKTRKERVARLDDENTQRPKSLQIEIAERKRTLSKYLNQKQVDKFIEMQNEYGPRHKPQHAQKAEIRMNTQSLPPYTPHTHQHQKQQQLHLNEYEFQRVDGERRNQHKQSNSINDSFEQFAEQQRFNHHKDYMRADPARPTNSQRTLPTEPQEIQYQIYHNGKGVPMPHLKADRLLQDAKPNSRHSSNSSNKVVGTIRSKRSPEKPYIPAAPPSQVAITGTLIKKDRVNSCRSEDNLVRQPISRPPVKPIITEYNTHSHHQNRQDGWEAESKSTRRQERTLLQYGERNSLDTVTVQKILETFQASNHHNNRTPQTLERIKESVFAQSSRGSPDRQRLEIYYCKIHQDQQIIYFCLKCNQLICSECALHGSHRSHQIHSLKKSALLLRQRLAHNTGTLSKLLMEQQSKQKILRECLHEMGIECARQKQQIRSSFQNFMFNVDKRYKELLKDVEDRFTPLVTEYSDRLNDCRNNHLQVSRVKDSVFETLQACAGPDEGTVSQTSIGAACNQLGNFNVKRPRTKPISSPNSIDCINRLTNSIRQLQQFLKSSNVLLFSTKKQSLLSQNSSLRLSDSSNLLEQPKQYNPTPQTLTPIAQSHFKPSSPDKRNKKIVVNSYSLNMKSRVKVSQCECIVESLLEMQEIVKAIKPDSMEYQLRALQCN